MKKTQLLLIATLSTSLLLAGCGKKKGGESAKESDASESEPEISYTVTEQEYADEIKHGGFVIDQNVTYAGNSIYGTMEADFAVEIDSNIIHGKMGGAMGLEDYVKIHYDTYDEGFVDVEVYSLEPGADFSAGKYYKENSDFSGILTEATYVLPVEYDDLEYNEEKQAYVLKETTTIFVIEGNMKITELEFKFVNGKLDSYKTRFGPEDDERISIYLDLQATKRGETHVEFPVFKEVSENVFNKWIKTLEFFTDLDNSATIEGNIHIYGEDYQIVRKIEENGIESIISPSRL